MNEMRIAFQSSKEIHLTRIMQRMMGQNRKVNAWDEDLIANIFLYGTHIVFESADRSSVFVMCIQFPKLVDIKIIQFYLFCYNFNHLWGHFECRIKFKDYIIDLIEKTDLSKDEIKEQLRLCKTIKISECDQDIPKLTKNGRKLLELNHHKCCSDEICFCFQEWPKEFGLAKTCQNYAVVHIK